MHKFHHRFLVRHVQGRINHSGGGHTNVRRGPFSHTCTLDFLLGCTFLPPKSKSFFRRYTAPAHVQMLKRQHSVVKIWQLIGDPMVQSAQWLIWPWTCDSITVNTINSSGDEIANLNFLYDDIAHALQNMIGSCINSAMQRSTRLEHRFTKISSRSFKVTDFGTNRKLIYDFLLVINTNLHTILHRFQVMADYWSNFR